MGSYKFIESWVNLSEKERLGFLAYVQGMYAHRQLPKEIVDFCNAHTSEELSGYTITRFLSVFGISPNNHKNKKRLLNVFSELTGRLHEYLVLQFLKEPKNANSYDLLRLQALSHFRMAGDYKIIEKKLQDRLNEKQFPNSDFHLDKINLRHAQLASPWSEHLAEDMGVILDGLMFDVEAYYMKMKLKLSMEMKNRLRVLNETHEIHDYDEFIRNARAEANKSQLFPKIYLLCLDIVEKDILTSFEELLEIFRTEKNLPLNNQEDILQILLNFCSQQNRLGGSYKELAFELVKIGLERGTYTHRGYFYHGSFYAVFIYALATHSYTWAKEFVEEWKSYLLLEKMDIEKLLLAKLYFVQGQFENVQSLLIGHSYENSFMECQCKVMQLQAQYELGYPKRSLIAGIDSLQQTLKKRTLLSQSYKILYVHFLQGLRHLAVGKYGERDMVNYLEKRKPIYGEEWLLEKAQTIKP